MSASVTTDLLTVDEAAQRLRLHRVSVYRAVQRGELEALRLGERGRIRIPRHALADFLRPAAPPAPNEREPCATP